MVSAASPRPVRLVFAPAPDDAQVSALAEALSVPRALAALLLQRGVGEVEAARRFLRPSLDLLGDPYLLGGMESAVGAITGAVRAGGPILVHGDYDVDGQCATALLTRALRHAGATVEPFVPHRMADGYDFREAGLQRAREVGARLILTCDCGITAVETVRAARAAGFEVVVTDHHLPGPERPPATAIVDPQLDGEDSPYRDLCGTGVAFKLVQALVPALGLPPNLPLHLLDYVALATVADVVPLQGENRLLVQQGLKVLARSRWPGLTALITSAGLAGKPIKAGHLGFVLGPRLNAVGRVGDAKDGLRLLLTDDEAEARALAERLESHNADRQALDQRILDEAIAQVEASARLELDSALVLSAEGWHAGVIGIVASRLVERYGRPAFMIAFDEETPELGAHEVVALDDPTGLKRCARRFDLLLVTANANLPWNALFATLAPRGRMHLVGAIPDPVPVPAFVLIGGQKSLGGSPLGRPATVARMLDFCARHDIRPIVERFPLSRVNAALAHLKAGKARWRIVLDNDYA